MFIHNSDMHIEYMSEEVTNVTQSSHTDLIVLNGTYHCMSSQQLKSFNNNTFLCQFH